jgi:hypothetical protein
MNKIDIIELLYKLDDEIKSNPLLEFLIIIKLIKKKCVKYKKCIDKSIEEDNLKITIPNQITKLINLIEQTISFIERSEKYLQTLDISSKEFLLSEESDGINKLKFIIRELKNRSSVSKKDVDILVDFSTKLLNKFLS